ncbi:N(G),N(G)-dimethylarginine dimethylaminohydrolase [Micromonospora sp. NPDC047707]|uniref:N(G),N(G)-dimethylarginine dimethylaminohydrolase n=1 Tax=Micromonospora sp. NPDC047707 TaxID=3154498 RepID=UPI003452CF96
MTRGTALVRRPSARLAEGLVTHIERTDVEVERARRQHDAYRAALADAGWQVHEVSPADHCPDSVFVEDTIVVYDDLAVITRPGAPQRRPETAGNEKAVREAGLEVVRVAAPGTLDGGDVLQVGSTVYVGEGGRTNGGGIAQLDAHLATRGRTVLPVPLRDVLHLKSAVTALPDGTLLALPDLSDPTGLRLTSVHRADASNAVVRERAAVGLAGMERHPAETGSIRKREALAREPRLA